MNLVTRSVTIVLAIGVALGLWRWLGDDQPILSPGWFQSSTEKFENLGDVSDKIVDNLPTPDSVDQAPLADILPEVGDNQ